MFDYNTMDKMSIEWVLILNFFILFVFFDVLLNLEVFKCGFFDFFLDFDCIFIDIICFEEHEPLIAIAGIAHANLLIAGSETRAIHEQFLNRCAANAIPAPVVVQLEGQKPRRQKPSRQRSADRKPPGRKHTQASGSAVTPPPAPNPAGT